jgi:beta-carotene hydroxylase
VNEPKPARRKIPARLLAPSGWRNAELVARAAAIWLGPAFAAFAIMRTWGLAWSWLTIPLFLLSGQGLHLVGFIGHEGFHGGLHRKRVTSFLIGMAASSVLPLHCDVGFCISHLKHHRSFDSEEDLLLREAQHRAEAKAILPRIFPVRSRLTRKYLRDTLSLAFRRWPTTKPLRIGLPMETAVGLARLNLLLTVAWFTFFMLLLWRHPLLGFCVLVGPGIGATTISSMRPFVEHAGTVAGHLSGSRSYTHPFFTFVFGGANFHLVHHLYPSVPCYRLPRLHAHLASSGAFADAALSEDPSFTGYFSYLRAPYPVPTSSRGES